MKVSLNWLTDYIDLPVGLKPEQLMHDLTLSTVEVEGIEYPGRSLDHICVGRIVSASPIEGTHLTLTKVDAGEHGQVQVICGAANARAGLLSVLALPGAHIHPKGAAQTLLVTSVVMRGLPSEGVLCAADELGLQGVFPPGSERGIIELVDQTVAVGTPLAAVIGFDDAVLEIDNKSLTNRPDLWGHYGIARELAAIYRVDLKPLPRLPVLPVSSVLLDPADRTICPRFTATTIEGVEINAAPLWMRSRLARVGQRSIDLMVDLTNYVMFASGQPSHAYDADQLSGALTARVGRSGESLLLLDGTSQDMAGLPVIADSRSVLAAAGVMGGARSGVASTTSRIFLEMASFSATVVRRSSQRLGVRSEASSRFEKAVDTQRIDQALAMFLALLQEIQPGARVSAFQDWISDPTPRAEVTVALDFIDSRLGKSFGAKDIGASLRRLGFDVEEAAGSLQLQAPTWRSTGDISLPADIVEEVARLHGYDNFTIVAPRIDLQRMPRDRRLPLDRRVRELVAAAGLQEVFTYPWAELTMLNAVGTPTDGLLELEAPPSPDARFLRSALVPNLLASVATNQHHFDEFGLFEAGAVFPGKTESKHLAGLLFGSDITALFGRLKGVLDMLVRKAHLQSWRYDVRPSDAGWQDPAVVTTLRMGDLAVGVLARVNNRCCRAAGIKRGEVVAFELDLGLLDAHVTRENRYQPLPAYPHTGFDLTLLVADNVSWRDMESAIRASGSELRALEWIGEYRGKGVDAGMRALTFRVRLGRDDRTLATEEAEEVRSRILGVAESRFGARQR